MNDVSTNQSVPILRRLLTNWLLLPSISLIVLGIFLFAVMDFGLLVLHICGYTSPSCPPLQIFLGFLSTLFLILTCLTPGLLLVMIFRRLYKAPILVLGIGALFLLLGLFVRFLRGHFTVEDMFLFTKIGFTSWVLTGTAQAILFITYVFAFLIFRLLSPPEDSFIDRLRGWVLTTILLIAGTWIVIGIVGPKAIAVAERKLAFKIEGLQSGVLYYDKGSSKSTIYRLKPNNQREDIDISPCEIRFVPSVMISWDQKLVFCRIGYYDDNPSKKATLVLVNLVTGERRTRDILSNEPYGYPLSQYSWFLDGRELLFSSYHDTETNTLYSLNTENMQFSEIYRLDNPDYKIDGAIYSPDKKRIAFLSEDEQENDSLFLMDANGSNVKSVPLVGVDCTNIASCTIYFLQFSKDSSKIFYGISKFSNIHNDIFNLYDMETGTNEQIRLSQTYDIDSLLFYDGERSIMYLDDRHGKNPNLLRHIFGDPQAKPMNISYRPVKSSAIAALSLNGEWLFYRDIEERKTWSTWAIRVSDGQRFRIMNEGEAVLIHNGAGPIFVYWFPS